MLVIGGGITGAGVALDAAARGYSVALVEKVDFASGTSSKSTKLAHGGIRYLPQFDFAMIHEGVVERGLMVRHAPFLVRPQAFVIPVYAQMRWPSSLPVRGRRCAARPSCAARVSKKRCCTTTRRLMMRN
ncbi:MAG: hypothetical protein AUI01_03460 [Ktedonobacter sp. 13_2_20CM_2_56_8]|nr:MAG: hypothetical protein AUI01_03460 [Ktedonobacter sp. 13_2_20CM_2_56_8]